MITIKNQYSEAILLIYSDMPTCSIVCSLYSTLRGKGNASRVMQAAERASILMGRYNIALWVDANSWQYDWYKRLGYEYLRDHDLPGFVWMMKSLYGDNKGI